MDQRFEKWDEWINIIYQEVQELVANQHTFSKVWSMVNRKPQRFRNRIRFISFYMTPMLRIA